MSRSLASEIHSERKTNQATWLDYQARISGILDSPADDLNDHVIREFNKKAIHLGYGSLAFSPYDAGFRCTINLSPPPTAVFTSTFETQTSTWDLWSSSWNS